MVNTSRIVHKALGRDTYSKNKTRRWVKTYIQWDTPPDEWVEELNKDTAERAKHKRW